MRPGAIISILLLTAGAVVGGVYFGRYGSVPVSETGSGAASASDLPISPTPPWPKLAMDENAYSFGTMALGEEQTHGFVVRNEGEAPLLIKYLEPSCACTVPDMEKGDVREIPPGGSTTIQLKWKPESPDPSFAKWVTFATNDPEHKQLRIGARGAVAELITILPLDVWDAGTFEGDEPVRVTGRVMSAVVDEFTLTSLESSRPEITAESRPLNADELTEMGAKCGYEVTVTVRKPDDNTVGTFEGTVTLVTDVQGAKSFPVSVSAWIPLPINLRPLSRNTQWIAERNALVLSEFDASEGVEGSFYVGVNGMTGEPFQLTLESADPSFVEASVEPRDVDDQGNGSYTLQIRIPPGSPPISRFGIDAGTLRFKTSHPRMPELTVRIAFKSH